MKNSKYNRIVSFIAFVIGIALSILSVVFSFAGFVLSLYICGTIGVFILVAHVIYDLICNQNQKPFDYISSGFEFLVSIIACAFMIANITDNKIQTIILSLSAAVYGGLLTLIGVAWTIKKADKDRKEDEIKKERPVFSYNMLKKEPNIDDAIPKFCFSDTFEKNEYKCDVFVEIENSNRSAFEMKRVFHDNNWVELEGNRVVLPNAKCILNFRFTDFPQKIFLEVEDLLKNKHYYQIKVLFLNVKCSSGKIFHTVREINEIEETEMNKIIKSH